jgi:hypothetical protein
MHAQTERTVRSCRQRILGITKAPLDPISPATVGREFLNDVNMVIDLWMPIVSVYSRAELKTEGMEPVVQFLGKGAAVILVNFITWWIMENDGNRELDKTTNWSDCFGRTVLICGRCIPTFGLPQ